MKTKTIVWVALTIGSFVFTSCKKNNPDSVKSSSGESFTAFVNGVFIVNEGPYGSGTGSISFYSKDSMKVSNNIYQNKNNLVLGNIVQSMAINNGKAYIVVNNSGKVVVTDATYFTKKAEEIIGLSSPRYLLGVSINKAYLSDWGAGGVITIDLTSTTITDTITTGNGPNKMLKSGNNVYVACNGGYGEDSVVTVIDATTDAVTKNINVGANPSEVVVDENGDIWVLCLGKWKSDYSALEKMGSLVKINGTTNVVDLSLPFSSLYSQPSGLSINSAKNKLYFNYNGGVYSHDIATRSLNSTAFIPRSFYGLGIDPSGDYIYASDAGDYVSNGKVLRYNSLGVAVDSFSVGVIPNGFYFN